MVQSAKITLIFILGSRRLAFDTLFSILTGRELIINSRPLTNVAEKLDNEDSLTPNRVLIQHPFNSLPPRLFGNHQFKSLKTWKNTQKLTNHIWRRLVKEYLPTLSRRSKWPNSNEQPLKVDDIVWLLKDRTPRGLRPLGIVVETTRGLDGETRVVKVKTALTARTIAPFPGLARVLFSAVFHRFSCISFKQRDLPPLPYWIY